MENKQDNIFSTFGFFMKLKYCFPRACLKKKKKKQKPAVINIQASKSNWPVQRGHPGVLVKEQIDDASPHDP